MNDPYKTLGVSPSATDEEIKAAYKELAKKYHPDNYASSPLADLAEEKMKEINEAYDTVTAQRRNGASGNSSYAGSYSGSSSSGGYSSGGYQNGYGRTGSSQFSDIRRLIHLGRISEAQELLDGVPESSRDAEWYFLKGTIYYQRGWLDEAFRYMQQAVNLDPGNAEYQAVYSRLFSQRSGGAYGFPGNHQSQMVGCSVCDTCSTLICANCLCNMCCGGDFCGC